MSGWSQGDGHEVREVARALVRQPVLRRTRQHRRLVDLASRHTGALQSWFEENLGWRALVEHDRVRLLKVPEDPGLFPDPTTPKPRQCALYCLVLAVLQDCGAQTVITELAERILSLSTAHTSVRRFEATDPKERRDLVVALRRLVEDGVLVPTQDAVRTGDGEQGYVAGHGNAIYDIDHRAAAFMVACPVPPSSAAGPGDLLRVPDPLPVPQRSGTGGNELRQAVMRRIVDHPVVYLDDLPEQQRQYLAQHQDEVLAAVRLGLDTRVEVRCEGLAVVDAELGDALFPAASAASFMALALADCLACELDEADSPYVDRARLLELAAAVADTVRPTVPMVDKRATDGAGVLSLAEPLLQQFGLITPDVGGATIWAAIARYRAPAGLGARDTGQALLLFGSEPAARSRQSNAIAPVEPEGNHDHAE